MAAPFRCTIVLILLAAAAGLAGCGLFGDGELAAQRARLLLAEEPAGAVSIEEAREQLAENDRVVLVGRIGAGADNPFVNGSAEFLLSEIVAGGHDHAPGHDADDCPFCRRAAAEAPTALVQFLDEQGEVLPIDAPKLFGVERGGIVVVRGRGEIAEHLDLFRITADGIYLRD